MFSGLESPWPLLVVLVIAALVFGPKRLPELGRSLGEGLRGSRRSLEGEAGSDAGVSAAASRDSRADHGRRTIP
ncbi:MAG: twin-arginine translocase TatA/TatE family subunit [Actinobacteria bacterium]|nr:twin-arginine translocase TatA/TatE family subunit [Actinomycetota bacterium]MBS1885383.1 twin-arginine translocase TatA/TatE family subunit [Actinomycetota bacterium]